jgi:hypothetical protein
VFTPLSDGDVAIAERISARLPEPKTEIPENIPNFETICQQIDEIRHTLDPVSSPGYPLSTRFPNNDSWQGEQSMVDLVVRTAAFRILLLCTLTDSDLKDYIANPMSWVVRGLFSVYSPFGKFEPHPRRKLLEKRYRNVWCCDVVDQLVAKWFLLSYCKELNKRYPNCPIAYGHGASDNHDSLFGEMHAQKCRDAGNVAPFRSDVSNWDGHFTWVAALMIIEVLRIRFNAPLWWQRGLRAHFIGIVCCPFQVNDGKVRIKLRLGLMPSGTFFTTVGNTIARMAACEAVGSQHYVALGDDCNEWNPCGSAERLTQLYSNIGLTLRDVEVTTPDEFEFCSRRYRRVGGQWRSSLTTWAKAAYKLFTRPPSPDAMRGVLHETRNNDPRIRAVVSRSC